MSLVGGATTAKFTSQAKAKQAIDAVCLAAKLK